MDTTFSYSGHQRSSDNVKSNDPSGVELPESSDIRSGVVGGAKYKLMSPAKLPISRSTCITIPPGLSPSSFLESPVLLTNMKAEPSPTTGSFMKPRLVPGSSSSAAYPVTARISNTNISNEGNSSCFNFNVHARENMVPADLNHHRNDQSAQVHNQAQHQSFASSSSVKSEMDVSSNESRLSAPSHMVTTGANAHTEIDGDEFNRSLQTNTNTEIQVSQFGHKGSGISAVAERSSDDGYNWRKYGQKHVKGSEFPRSYYKCTHPNCEVKKLFERSHEGHITEIIYKGTHDHPKPQPSRRYTAGNSMPIQEERSDKLSSLTGQEDKSSSRYGQISHAVDPNGTLDLSPVTVNDDSIDGDGSLPSRNHDEADDDDPFSKRRKMDISGYDVTPVVKPIREPRVVVQTLSEVDILDDGYRWRKYGQKVVRGNPNPRSYYKCTNVGCPVRKHVERASHDPKAVITTYEGKHNHDVPTAKSNSHDIAGPSAPGGPSGFRTDESDSISLDLGVGINHGSENKPNEYRQNLHSELVDSRILNSRSTFKVVQASPFGILNSSINQYGSRENLSEGRNIEINPYAQNIGRILTGP